MTMMENKYHQQASLMLQLLPIVAKEKQFALKGGTAINFFVRDFPRYSVDVDLTYIGEGGRDNALLNIAQATESIAKTIEKLFPKLKVVRKYTKKEKRLVKLFVNSQSVQVKIEPNELVRGSVYPVEDRVLTPGVQAAFESFVKMPVLAIEDLYGGKICAALDRQHPRDLFDIFLLLENEGITDAIRKAFVVYLCSHNRPMGELLDPNFHDVSLQYERDFVGMTTKEVSLKKLTDARAKLVSLIHNDLTESERHFLLSVKMGEPNWSLIDISGLQEFPAIQWKLLNIRKMDAIKQRKMLAKLKRVLEL